MLLKNYRFKPNTISKSMRRAIVICIFILLNSKSEAQKPYPINYKQLKEYQGIYQYLNNSTLKIAASPRDTILYAIINEH